MTGRPCNKCEFIIIIISVPLIVSDFYFAPIMLKEPFPVLDHVYVTLSSIMIIIIIKDTIDTTSL